MSNPNILITGITGFVGKYLRQHLEKNGNEVSGITQSPNKTEDRIFLADITDLSSLEAVFQKVQPNQIYHLAALASPRDSFAMEEAYRRVNIDGTRNLLTAASTLQVKPRILFVSSAEVYGSPDQDQLPITENHPINPNNPYAQTKVEAESIVQEFIKNNGLDICIARPSNHYGAGQEPNFALPSFAKQIAEIEKGLQKPLLSTGNLAPKRDFTSVKDVVRAYQLIMEKGKAGEAYNICSGGSKSMEHYLEVLRSFSGKDISMEIDPAKLRPSDIMDNRGSHEKLTKATGWNPEVSLEEGLREVYDFYCNKCRFSP